MFSHIQNCTTKETVNKMKRKLGVFANHIFDKELISKILSFSHNLQLTLLTMDKRLEHTFLQTKHINGQQLYEKVLNTMNYQRNPNKKKVG